MINKYYQISNVNHKKVALFSDIHYSKHYNNSIFLAIINNLKENKPDYICIAGDIIDDRSTLEVETLRNRLYKFIEYLGKICPVIIIPGNHDLVKVNHNKVIYSYDKDYFESFNNIDNIYYLDNKNIVIDNINFIGFNICLEYYEKYKEKNNDILCNELNKIKPNIKDDKYNILLFHSPIGILNKKVIQQIPNIDLILSGHMHNGLVLKIFDKTKFSWGFVGPFKEIFPRNARNTKKININGKTISLVISGGIIKLAERTKLTKYNKLFGSHIEYIEI